MDRLIEEMKSFLKEVEEKGEENTMFFNIECEGSKVRVSKLFSIEYAMVIPAYIVEEIEGCFEGKDSECCDERIPEFYSTLKALIKYSADFALLGEVEGENTISSCVSFFEYTKEMVELMEKDMIRDLLVSGEFEHIDFIRAEFEKEIKFFEETIYFLNVFKKALDGNEELKKAIEIYYYTFRALCDSFDRFVEEYLLPYEQERINMLGLGDEGEVADYIR